MKILYITEIYPDPHRGIGVWGGGEKRFYELARKIAMRGHDVNVLSCHFPGQPQEETLEGVKIHRTGLSRDPKTGGAKKALIPVALYVLKTAKLAMKINADIIHCNTYFPVYAGAIVSKVKGIPLVSTFHDIYGFRGWIESQRSLLWGLLGHLATLIAVRLPQTHFISVSPQCKAKLLSLGIPHEKITVIPNGVDLKLFDSIKSQKINNQILYVGRLVNFKHVDWLIMAFSRVKRRIPDAKLKIVGDGPERKKLEKLVRKLGLEKDVTFTGLTPTYEAVAQYYKESEIFVLPSTVEGEAIVLKEAMAARLPLIGMSVPGSGVLSLIRDGENGFLLKPGRPDLIAEKIELLLTDKRLAKKMGYKGRRFVEKYDWKQIASRVLETYENILSKRR